MNQKLLYKLFFCTILSLLISINTNAQAPGTALNFDGVDDYVTVAAQSTSISGSYTVMAWVRPTNASKAMHVFSTRESGEFSFDMQVVGGNTIHADIGDGGSFITTSANASFNYQAGRWMHIAYVISPTSYTIYVNGRSYGGGGLSSTPLLLDNDHYIVIGKNAIENTYFEGSIDEVKVYSAELTEANIQNDMVNTTPSVPASLVAHYNFDQTGTTLTDQSSNGYNGTVTNFALSGSTSNWVESYAMVLPGPAAESNITPNSFTINWTAPVTGTVDNGYILDVSDDYLFSSAITGSPFSVAGTSKNITGLMSGTSYFYRVRADKTSVTGQGAYTSTFGVTTSLAYDYLSAVSISNTTLSSAFSSSTISYTGIATSATVSVIAKQNHTGTTIQIQVNGGGYTSLTSGVSSSAVPLNTGSNTIELLVTDGSLNKTYTFTITRVASTTRYIKQVGAGTMDGSSWANASDDLQAMINASSAYDMIWVAGGTYKPNRKADATGTITANDRSNAFILKEDVRIYGGFAGTENSLNGRDLTNTPNKSILSGDFNSDDAVSGSGSLLVLSNNSENAYHVVISSGTVSTAVLDGFTITGGNANASLADITVNGNSIVHYSGGGMSLYDSSPELNNIIITRNAGRGGAGMMLQFSSPKISHSSISSNAASGGSLDNLGGGMYNYQSSSPLLTDVIVSENVSTAGGGMYNRDLSSPTLTNVTIKNNHARGSRPFMTGGGISNADASSPVITNVSITGNTAKTGGGIDNYLNCYPVLTNVTISGNSASENGGGISNESSSDIQIRNSIIWGNGINIHDISSTPSVEYSIIEGGYPGIANTSDDPLFVDVVNDNYSLQAGSPAVDVGNVDYFLAGQAVDLSHITTDLNDHSRFTMWGIDIGAYERYESLGTAALNFDGVNDKITFPAPASAVSGSFTVMAWVKPTNGTKEMHILSTKTSDNNSFDIRLKNANTIHATIGDGSAVLAATADATYNYTADRWMHIAYAVSPTDYTIYVNGEQQATGPLSGTPLLMDNDHLLQIGNNNADNTFFEGSIDEVRIYNTVLTQSNIQADMVYNTSLPEKLVAYYNFDGGEADWNNPGNITLEDMSFLGGYNGTLSGFALTGSASNYVESYAMVIPTPTYPTGVSSSGFIATWSAPSIGSADNGYMLEVATDNTFTTPITGSPFTTFGTLEFISGLSPGDYYYRVRADKFSVTGQGAYSKTETVTLYAPPGNALNFDGSNDYVSVGAKTMEVSENFTVMAWVRPTDATKSMHIFSTRESGNQSFDMQLTGGNKIHGDIGSGTTWITNTADANYNYAVNQWLHVAYTVTNGGYKIYANGIEVGSGTFTGTPLLLTSSHYITIGKNASENTYFKGSIDEVKVYNAELTPLQIQTDMIDVVPSLPGNLIAYYNFDQSSTTLNDQSGYGYTGALKNFALAGATSNWVESYAMIIPEVTMVTDLVHNSFTANWNAPVNGTVDNYIFDVATDSAFTLPVAGSPFTVSGVTKNITGLAASTIYYYRVRADKTTLTGQGASSETFMVTTSTAPLPVTLLNYNAKAEDHRAKLTWTTASELNNKEFIISRSQDGKTFSAVSKIDGEGNSHSVKNYFLYDPKPYQGINYYQLEQVDHNGKITNHGVRVLTFNSGLMIKHYPNPTKDIVTIEFAAGVYNSIEISTPEGRSLQRMIINEAENSTRISLNNYPAGTYLIKMSGVQGTEVKQVIKK
jgi:hypothetical protein